MTFSYILRRLGQAIPTFIGVTILAFFLSYLAPGSPVDAMLSDPRITVEEIERMKEALGLNRPIIVQYFYWLGDLLTGNLGTSFRTGENVARMIGSRIGPTLLLSSMSLLLSLLIAVPLGVYVGLKPNSKLDYFISGSSFLLVSVPNFFAGLSLIYIFSVLMKVLPSGGMYNASGDRSFANLLRHMILPCLVLSFQQLGSFLRYMRSSVLSVSHQEYIRTAKAKGFSPSYTTAKHIFKNSLIPLVTVVGMNIPNLVGGAVVTEQVFSWPGIGTLMVQAVGARDYPVIMGLTVLIAVTVFVANLVTDFIYASLDPRIVYES